MRQRSLWDPLFAAEGGSAKRRHARRSGTASLLKHLEEAGISFELASFEGGTAGNAIPPKAKAIIVVDADVVGRVE